jgi:GPH family glycoside/pentoside/hexuronide:cation symporter
VTEPSASASVSVKAPALALKTVAIFSLGDWGPSTTSTAVLFFLPFFLTDIAHITAAQTAIVLLVGGVCDALSVPLMGAWSDRTQTRWGRRRPFLLFGSLPFALAFCALWWIPPGSSVLRTLYFALAYVLFDASFASVQVPYASLTPELAQTDTDRTRLNAGRAIVSMLGGLAAAACIPAAIAAFSVKTVGYQAVMATVAALAAVPFVLLFIVARERPRADAQTETVHANHSMASLLAVPAVREAAVIYLVCWSCVSIVASMFEYYLTHVLHLVGKLDVFLGLVQLSALVSVAPVAWANDNLGRYRTLAIGAAWWSAVLAILFVLPAQRVALGYLLAISCGPGIASAHVVPWTLIAESVDADQKRSGFRREGAIYGLLGLVQKAGVALAVAGAQAVLSAAGYLTTLPVGTSQTARVQLAIRAMFAGAPALVLLTLAVALWHRWSTARKSL